MIALPATDFHRKGNLIFLLIDGRYHNVGNSADVDKNYLNLCGLTFPVMPGRKIADEEKDYLRKNAKDVKKLRDDIEKEVEGGKGIEYLTNELALYKGVDFFLTEICAKHNPHLKIRHFSFAQQDVAGLKPFSSEQTYFDEIIKEDSLVVNGRVYPLRKSQKAEFVNLNGVNYTIDRSRVTVDDVEKKFHELLTGAIRSFVISNSDVPKKMEREILLLKRKIAVLTEDLKVKQYPHCFECGDIGFDTSIRSVYWLIPAHYNSTSCADYSEGQSAVSLPFANNDLIAAARFVDRANRNSPFSPHPHSNCYGFGFAGSTLEDKMQYLHTCATVVFQNKRFYQEESSSSDGSY